MATENQNRGDEGGTSKSERVNSSFANDRIHARASSASVSERAARAMATPTSDGMGWAGMGCLWQSRPRRRIVRG